VEEEAEPADTAGQDVEEAVEDVEDAEEAEEAAEPTESAAAEPASGDRVQIRWYVGLGTGTDPEQIAVQEEVAEDFNSSQDRIQLVVEVVPYEAAYDTLSTQIA